MVRTVTQPKTVCVIGLGYIGLPTASLLAHSGYNVVGVDVNTKVIETLNKGMIHITEPDLEFSVKSAVESGRLRAVLRPEAADIFVIAVPTPFKEHHKPDLAYVEAAVDSIAPVVKKGSLVILESTSPVGTTEMIAARLTKARTELGGQIDVAYCPERVLPGQILRELVENDRVVGGATETAAEKAQAFYQTFVRGQVRTTNSRTAELVKLSENAFRDVNIAFANELSVVCEKLGVDVWNVIEFANRHPRVKILNPGPGVGGHCIAVDPWFIVASCPEETPLLRTAREVNDSMPHRVVDRVVAAAKSLGKQRPTVACLGLSYKANIDDVRESPAVEVAQLLGAENSIQTLVVEPYLESLPPSLEGKGLEFSVLDAALLRADIAVLLVDHNQFKAIKPGTLQGKTVVDTRGLWR